MRKIYIVFLAGIFLARLLLAEEANVYVALDGDDENPGIISKPKATIDGAIQALNEYREQGLLTKEMPVNIWLRGGIYRPQNAIWLGGELGGSEKAPFRIRGMKGEKVVFDHGLNIPRAGFSKSKMEGISAEIVEAKISDPATISALSGKNVQLSYGERMMTLARYPNQGFAIFGNVMAYDKAQQKGTRENPVGIKVQLNPASQKDWNKWLPQSPDARLVGYMSADWLKVEQVPIPIGEGNAIQLVNGSRYGIKKDLQVGRVYLENVLCELDSPGEWFFDRQKKTLYLWPPAPFKKGEGLTVWGASGGFNFGGANYASVENITFRNFHQPQVGSSIINISSGSHNEVRGCTFKNIAPPSCAFNIRGGTHNGMRGCDFYDLEFGGRLGGGSYRAEEIIEGKNFIENCHFTQVFSKSFYGKVVAIIGAGNIFRHNLCHNHNGQIITLNGVDHQIELNEIFNTGVEEGDGGSFYQGAMAESWGIKFENNFFHHIMCIPEMYERAAIFSDDGDLGDTVIGNVFYKAGAGFKVNGGGGHYAAHNLSVEGLNAFKFHPGNPPADYKAYMNFLNSNNPSVGEKQNVLGRGFKFFGVKGWQDKINDETWLSLVSPYWMERYPRMKELFELWYRRKAALKHNVLEHNGHKDSVGNPFAVGRDTKQKSNRKRGRGKIATLDFSTKPVANKYHIPFEKIGLYQDEFRLSPPDKEAYRSAVSKHWRGDECRGAGRYDPGKILKRQYFNTGLLIKRLKDPELAPDLKLHHR